MSRGVIIAIIIVVIVVIIIGIVIAVVVFSGDSAETSSANVMSTGNTSAAPSMAPLTTQEPNATSVGGSGDASAGGSGGASAGAASSDVVPDGYIMINQRSSIPAPPRIYCPADGYSGIEIKDGKQMCFSYKEADGKATMNWVEPVLFGA